MIDLPELLGGPPVKAALCIPTWDRPVAYLPQVIAAYEAQEHADWTLYVDAPLTLDLGVNDAIIRLFDRSFREGARFAVYLADDCVPSSDFTRLAQVQHGYVTTHNLLAFGLWWPTGPIARLYPEIVFHRSGHTWPAKAWGCSAERWPELRSVILNSVATYDVSLAAHLWATRASITVPLCSRVRDIGEVGRYTTTEDWRKYFSWIADAPPFDDYYKFFQ